MSIIIFIIILSVLVIVHELGHFLVAKKFGIKVDEFGLGYPPKAKSLFKWKGTDFTLNWLPFGGFVRIFGENPTEEEIAEDSFQSKNRGIQAAVLVAGVAGNFLFAWLLISLGFMTGLAAPVGTSLPVEDAKTVITTVLPGSPADEAGLKAGDAIVSLTRGGASPELSPESISDFIDDSREPIAFIVDRGGNRSEISVSPEEGVVEGKPAIGIAMDVVGSVHLPPHKALWHGLVVSSEMTWLTAKALGTFIISAISGSADLSQVTGPVGIVSMVGDVTELGFSYLVTFTAVISINLAIINLVPFPALDGGRLLFVGIEALIRRPVPARIFNAVNTAGFFLLIFLMILITVRDVRYVL
jgi:regulator of sigma E protease